MLFGWAIFIAMVVVFAGAVVWMRLPVGVSIALAAVTAGLLSGLGVQPLEFLRQLTEGEMAYFDPVLYILSATIFMVAIERSGLLGTVARWLIVTFHRVPVLLLTAVTALVIFPGMMTGSSTAAVLSTGALVTPVLMKIGVPRDKTGAIITMIAIFGLAAPPVNIPALIICAGADIPYVGLGLPLILLTVPPALACTLWLGLPHARGVRLADIEATLPPSLHAKHGWKLYLPLLLLAGLLIGEHVFPAVIGHFGLPLIFVIAAAAAPLTGERTSPWNATQEALKRSAPILAILMGVGMFIQMMTHSGARGAIAVSCAALPRSVLYPMMGLSLPLFGAVSSYGAASVLGVPFVLTLAYAQQIIIMVAAVSLLACLGDLTPPTAKAGLFAAAVVGERNYLRIVRHCALPAFLTIIMCVLVIRFSGHLGFLVSDVATETIQPDAHAALTVPVATAGLLPSINAGWLLHAIPIFYRLLVGFFAVSVLAFLWRETSRLAKINALILAVPLVLRFLLVV